MSSGIKLCALSEDEVYSKLYHASQEGAYASYIRGKRCVNEQAFFYEISASFQFPRYFGENWAAFDECMCDLEWITFEHIFIVVDDYSAMFKGNTMLQKLLTKYLCRVVDYWHAEGIEVEVILNN